MFIDQYWLMLVAPTLILSLWAQFKVKSTFAKYSNVPSSRRISGQEAASILLRTNKINNVRIEAVGGSLTDHYDPRSKTVRLSQPVFSQTSIAAIGVAAHEAGHAIQDARSYGPLVLRSTLVPIANIGSQAGPLLAIAGLFFFPGSPLFYVGIALFGGAVLFYLVTLPVEFDASARAIAILRSNNVLSEKELDGVKKVLTAAALTYVASALTAVMSLIRLILIARGRR